MKPVAVIGAGGYVGARLIERSALLGELPLVPIVRSWRSQGRLARFGLRTVQGSASEAQSLIPLLKGCGMAVNLTMGQDKAMVGDVQAIHQACRVAEVPLFVHMSSAEVFGQADAPALREDSIPDQRHWMEYAREKAAAETWLRAQQGSVKTVILRPGLIWGPGSGWLVGPAQALVDGTAYLFNNGRGICNLIHVDNLVQHLLQLASADDVESGVYNISDIETHTWADYYAAIAHEVGVDESTIHRLKEYNLREGPLQRLAWFAQSPPAKAIKRRLKATTKIRVKQQIQDLIRPPAREKAQPFNPPPHICKQMWWIQGTVKKLPSCDFKDRYPHLELQPFPELMSAAGRWLRYAGFENVSRTLNEN